MKRREPFIKLEKETKPEANEEIRVSVNTESTRFSDIDRALRAQEYRLEKKAENALIAFLKFEFWKTVLMALVSLGFMLWVFTSTPSVEDIVKMFKVPVVKVQAQKNERQEDKKISCISREVDGC